MQIKEHTFSSVHETLRSLAKKINISERSWLKEFICPTDFFFFLTKSRGPSLKPHGRTPWYFLVYKYILLGCQKTETSSVNSRAVSDVNVSEKPFLITMAGSQQL